MVLSGGQSQGLSSHGNFASLTLAPALDVSSYPETNFPYLSLSGEAVGSQEHPCGSIGSLEETTTFVSYHYGCKALERAQNQNSPNHRHRTWEPQPSPVGEV